MNHTGILELLQNESPEAAELRRINSKILHLSNGKNFPANLMFTSSELGEGKSTIATIFAVTLARYRTNNVLLIDADLRRPRIHELFGMENSFGLSEALEGRCEGMQVVRNTAQQNLKIVTAGKVVKTPSDLLNEGRVKEVFQEFKFYFDRIIVDSPPILPVSDPIVLGMQMDGVILIIRAGKTKKEVVRRAKSLLDNAGIPVIGAILNDFGEVLPYYCNYRYYHNKYY